MAITTTMSKKETVCPDCGGAQIIAGRYLGQTDAVGVGQVFRPGGLKLFKLSWTGSDIPVSSQCQACLDCGLFWNRANPQKIRKVVQALGSDTTKKELGI